MPNKNFGIGERKVKKLDPAFVAFIYVRMYGVIVSDFVPLYWNSPLSPPPFSPSSEPLLFHDKSRSDCPVTCRPVITLGTSFYPCVYPTIPCVPSDTLLPLSEKGVKKYIATWSISRKLKSMHHRKGFMMTKLFMISFH